VGSIRGGVSANVVPDSCRASLDIRIPPGVTMDQVLAEFDEAARRAEAAAPGMKARITQKAARVPVATPLHERIVKVVLGLCQDLLGVRRDAGPTPGYATDASVVCRAGDLPFVIIGPGQEEMAHKPDEYVLLEDYLLGIEFYCALAERYLGSTGG
jgi:succinyl-diaminopimelate desuccinylase